jgi:hypothetical protein
MADRTPDNNDRTPTAGEKSFNESPKILNKYTLIMVAAAAIFLIVFGILFTSFLNNPTGGSGSNQNSNQSRANP